MHSWTFIILQSIHSSRGLCNLKINKKNKCWFLFWMSVMAILLPFASNVRAAVSRRITRISLAPNTMFNGINFYFVSYILCIHTSRQLQISHAVTCKNAAPNIRGLCFEGAFCYDSNLEQALKWVIGRDSRIGFYDAIRDHFNTSPE